MVVSAASLWCFAAALVLPFGLAGAFAALFYVHTVVNAQRSKGGRLYRQIYTASTEITATLAAAGVIERFGRSTVFSVRPVALVAVVCAMLTYTLVQQVLIVSAVYLARRPIPVRRLVGRGDEQAMEFATLALGVLFAVAMTFTPWLSPLSLVVIVVLRRGSLVRQLQEQATRDAKTGLLNAGAWRHAAERELARGERLGGSMSVLMIDLDHFKRLNDEFGHQAGDVALQAVAATLQDALRGYDAVGRFGGEEFIALLTEADEDGSQIVAERLRARIEALALPHGKQVTASIGVGLGTPGVHDLDHLIGVADKALYVAKRSGRNRVHLSQAPAATVAWPTNAPQH